FSLMVRPLLSLCGFILGLLVFALALSFITMALSPFAHYAAYTNGGALILANIGLVLLFDVLAYAAANTAFKGIYLLPDQALRWISQFTITDSGTSVSATTSTSITNGGAPIAITSNSNSSSSLSVSNHSSQTASAAAAKELGMKTALFPN